MIAGQSVAQAKTQPQLQPQLQPRATEPFQKIRIKADYHVYWAGFVVADVWSELILSEDSYKLSTAYRTRGILSLFSKAESESYVVGRVADNGRYHPLLYKKQGHWGSTAYKHLIRRDPDTGAPEAIRIYNEDHKWNREPVPKEYWSLPDPMTYMTALLTTRRESLLPDREGGAGHAGGRIFNGAVAAEYEHDCSAWVTLERQRKSLYEGTAVRCRFGARILAGRTAEERARAEEGRKKTGKKAGESGETDEKIDIWFAPWKDLPLMIPVRSRFKTGWGTANMYLSKLDIRVLLEDVGASSEQPPEHEPESPESTEQEDREKHLEEFLGDRNL